MDKKEEAINVFNNGFNCSQAVLSVFCEKFGLDKETALKISTGFGGGFRKGEVCGAVSGAIMTLGLESGHYIDGDTKSKSKAYALTKEFIRRFEEKNESIICKKLLGYDLSDEREYNIIREKGLFNSICPKVIMDAVGILEDIFSEKKGK
ncbi:C-GCAxxG-C-C family protein [Clostridium estertheticum]|uniref:C-GCAxxG-C-C family protein n=1 Tax=Clostridium estertheticum TaxID=238834 RepID=UPI001C0B7FBC|nr:C-GCAxxG-C-C family protein [Clostridium estertheticum]MBU3073112.1 C-GCAxxG-C-C family protein [Clostridium estertheticum]MBU3162851.1 C-GCAxxG-C-C family protein [Clostridium estertheticum]